MTAKADAFRRAMDTFIASIERLGDEAAVQAPADGGWNAAQIAWHVAVTNELLAGVFEGTVPMAQPVPDGFEPDPDIFSKVPAKVQTFPQLEPPASASRVEALAKLRASIAPVVNAFETFSEERAKGYFVQFPMGPLTMYQFADFTVGHVTRHQGQLERAVAAV